jgi:hypothetical protein
MNKLYKPATCIGLLLLALQGREAVASTNVAASQTSTAETGGFWVLKGDGVASYGGAPDLQSGKLPGNDGSDGRVMTSMRNNVGYWVVDGMSGEIQSYGAAPQLCKNANGEPKTNIGDCAGWTPYRKTFAPDISLDPVIAMAPKPDDSGLWFLTRYGRVFTTGTAQSYGDVQRHTYSGCLQDYLGDGQFVCDPNARNEAKDIAVTPSGNGYYVVLEKGYLFTFGDAKPYGDNSGVSKNGERSAGITPYGPGADGHSSATATGYWIVGERGGVFSFGDAPFLGSSGGNDSGIRGISRSHDRRGYAWASSDGRIDYSRRTPVAGAAAVESAEVVEKYFVSPF